MTEFRLKKLHVEGEDWLVRICVPVALVSADQAVPGSIIRECEECDVPVWFDPNQVIPDPPPESNMLGTVILCYRCGALHMAAQTEPVQWLDQPDLDLP